MPKSRKMSPTVRQAVRADVSNSDIHYAQAAVLTSSDFAFARDGIAAEAKANEKTLLLCEHELDDLAHARSSGAVTPRLDRRPDLGKTVTSLAPSPTGVKGGPLGNQPGASIGQPAAD
jgi:hypothetical protein